MKDINSATPVKVYGVGQVLSERNYKLRKLWRDSIDGSNGDVWGLSPEVIDKIKMSFKVVTIVKKIDINNASIKELGQFMYFKMD
jgi:hypothetical protein